MKLEILLDLISDRQLREYVDWLEIYPDSTEEDSLDFLMEILTDSQLDMLLETDEFNTPTPDGSCILIVSLWWIRSSRRVSIHFPLWCVVF